MCMVVASPALVWRLQADCGWFSPSTKSDPRIELSFLGLATDTVTAEPSCQSPESIFEWTMSKEESINEQWAYLWEQRDWESNFRATAGVLKPGHPSMFSVIKQGGWSWKPQHVSLCSKPQHPHIPISNCLPRPCTQTWTETTQGRTVAKKLSIFYKETYCWG